MAEYDYSSEASVDDDDDIEVDDDSSEYEADLDIQDDNSSSPSTSSDLKTEVIEPKELKEEIDKAVDKAVSVLGFSPDVVKALLNSFSWDSDKLFEKFYEAESPEDFFKKQKIDVPNPNQKDFVVKEGDCMICFEWKNNLVGFSCHHFFCSDCWNSYLLARIRSEGDPHIFCPEPDCHIPINEENVIRLLKSSTEQAFFKNLVIQSFVNSNAVMRRCPADKCDNVIKVKNAEFGQVSCSCGTSFCFLCSQEWHEPMTCSLLAKWIKKYSGDSESMKWVSVNTKDCPKCNAAIEKNGGCNHMVCRNKHCNYEFCWFCMKDWKIHGYDNNGCNRFREQNDNDQVNAFRESLRRYMHYYDRFANHRKSLQAENELLLQISLKIEEMQNKSFSWVETEFLRQAAEILQRCRRILMYTYAFAYYLPASNHKEIFEANQADLERSTELLSGLLEREIDYEQMDIPTLKQKVQDLNVYVEQRRVVLIQHCEEGIEKGFWKFTSDE